MWNLRWTPTILGVNLLGGGAETLGKQDRKTCGKNSLTNSAEVCGQFSEHLPDQNKKITPNPLCRASGSRIAVRGAPTPVVLWTPEPGSAPRVPPLPYPSFPWCFCFLGVFLAAQVLGLFECLLLIFQGFQGFVRWEKVLSLLESLLLVFEGFWGFVRRESPGCSVFCLFSRDFKGL